jgi:hypothetical protein
MSLPLIIMMNTILDDIELKHRRVDRKNIFILQLNLASCTQAV